MLKAIQIFRAGRHTSTSGHTISFSESDLQAAARAYDPTVHEAPLVVGHPRHDAPAYGWVSTLRFAERALEAEPAQVDEAFAELVSSGRFKKVSASFYRPESESNPVPGVYYLRHVGFLGAAPPSVKGLRQAEFADAGDDIVELEFGEADGSIVRQIARRLREWFIAKHGTEDADQVVPDWMVDEVERETPVSSPEYAETEVSDVEKAELERRERQLKDREAEFAEREERIAEAERKAQRAEVSEFVEGLVSDGKVLPRDKAGLIEFMAAQDSEAVVEFGEGDDKVKKPARQWLEGFLKHLPPAIDYAERGNGDEPSSAEEQDPAEIAKRAAEFREREAKAGRTVSVSQAVQHVTKAAG